MSLILRSSIDRRLTIAEMDGNFTYLEELALGSSQSTIPAGGTTGQVLAKASDADLDLAWVDQTGGGGGASGTSGTSGTSGRSVSYSATINGMVNYTIGGQGFYMSVGKSYLPGDYIRISSSGSDTLFARVDEYNASNGYLGITTVYVQGSGGNVSGQHTVNLSGVPGVSGSTSGSGTSGTSGESGTSGTSGIAGSSGTSGTSGIAGSSGTSGTSGISGANGTSGTSGISAAGMSMIGNGYYLQSSDFDSFDAGKLSAYLVNEDNENIEISLPEDFGSFSFLGSEYSSVFVNSNSYVTFGGTSSEYEIMAPEKIPFPAIFIGAGDNSLQYISIGYDYDVEPGDMGDQIFRIRFEGSANLQGSLSGIVGLAWEMHLDKANKDTIKIVVASLGNNNAFFRNERNPGGVYGISDGSKWTDIYPSLPTFEESTGTVLNTLVVVPSEENIIEGIKFVGPGVYSSVYGTTSYVKIDPLNQFGINVGYDNLTSSPAASVVSSSRYDLRLTTGEHGSAVRIRPRGEAWIQPYPKNTNQVGDGHGVYVYAGGASKDISGAGTYSGGSVYIQGGAGAGGSRGSVYIGLTSSPWKFASSGNLIFPDSTTQSTAWAGGRVVGTPSRSNGKTGDLKGDIAFDGNHIYYCSDNFGGTVVSIETSTSSGITRSYFIAYSDNPGFTSADLTGYSVSGPGYEGTVTGPSVDQGGNLWQIPVSPDILQQTGTYVFTSPGDIWKRVAWSNDTW